MFSFGEKFRELWALISTIVNYRRSRIYPWRWLWPETVRLPKTGAQLFLRDARLSPNYRILRVRCIA